MNITIIHEVFLSSSHLKNMPKLKAKTQIQQLLRYNLYQYNIGIHIWIKNCNLKLERCIQLINSQMRLVALFFELMYSWVSAVNLDSIERFKLKRLR
jgi:hypothetical protein